ncbi:hypothetical protein SHKM778_50240 [Streptomyces sp. KM77-8]|uniref:T6SS Phospholipase effector Tle1-like catalytic domain-containing protein n=1 Tax=Streptomyces haneummycinicus TaxID=3074435 RepID=A0AAT9HMR5_9ACTN
MAKRLVVCCDGTWNFADQPSKTNVAKVALSVLPGSAAGKEQRVYYHSGVGTLRRERLRGGAFGAGLSRNVVDAYRFLVETYEADDELFLFGFSRGAFTARSLAGLVRNSGILRRSTPTGSRRPGPCTGTGWSSRTAPPPRCSVAPTPARRRSGSSGCGTPSAPWASRCPTRSGCGRRRTASTAAGRSTTPS